MARRRSSKRKKINPTNVEGQGEMHGAVESEETEIIRRVTRSEDRLLELSDELLCGIPNEVTLKYIAARLPFRAWQIVATLSADWERAFQGGMVYDARVRSQATQEFLLVSCYFLTNARHESFREVTVDKRTLSLFSPSEERWYKFPPIPGCHEGILHDYQYALLDGSIYLVGGTRTRQVFECPSSEVLVLDLARHPIEWRRCANMQVSRFDPVVRVMHGKIFVFGGVVAPSDFQFETRHEVYDPKVDIWSFIAPTRPLASIYSAFSVGQQFFACIGSRTRDEVMDFLDDEIETKFVVKVDDRGPKLRSTTDVDAEDDMDGLHEIIANELVNQPVSHYDLSPIECLISKIGAFKTGSFYGFYDPVKDEWRDFDAKIFRTVDVDEHRPKQVFYLREVDDVSEPDEDGPEPEPPAPEDEVIAYVWSMSL